jgi:ketosteroid isomerase-like protein
MFDIDETWTPQETVIDGDLAYQRGTFTVEATPKAGGNKTRTSGTFLRIYRRQPDGSGAVPVLDHPRSAEGGRRLRPDGHARADCANDVG